MSDDLLISTRGLTKSYNGVPVLDSLDMKVPKNSIIGFLGPNGAGKTTTIKLMLGLIRPTGGSCSIFGMDAVRDSIAIRRRIGYLAQEPRYYDYMTARQTLKYVARFFYRGPDRLIDETVEECLRTVSLEDKADRSIKGFSGGERQRLGIAQALVNLPDLLILDEPAASLDPIGRHDVLKILDRLRGRTTVFYSTHILDDVQRVSDTVVILNRGRLVAQAPIEQMLAGNGGSATYNVVASGDQAALRLSLNSQAWIASFTAMPEGLCTRYEVAVADGKTDGDRLFALLSHCEGIEVKEFAPKKYRLEDIFIDLVEGEKNAC
jgi:ABC-2 type transport system ATP-binding protein